MTLKTKYYAAVVLVTDKDCVIWKSRNPFKHREQARQAAVRHYQYYNKNTAPHVIVKTQ